MNIDTTKPSTGRIYDYVLGGHHNFEVDRAAAQQILKMSPSYTTWARLNRWFLQMVADQWASSGHHHILDLGSGMPTQGHFHSAVPHAKVLYTDIDPVTVAYAQEVIGDNPLDPTFRSIYATRPISSMPRISYFKATDASRSGLSASHTSSMTKASRR